MHGGLEELQLLDEEFAVDLLTQALCRLLEVALERLGGHDEFLDLVRVFHDHVVIIGQPLRRLVMSTLELVDKGLKTDHFILQTIELAHLDDCLARISCDGNDF